MFILHCIAPAGPLPAFMNVATVILRSQVIAGCSRPSGPGYMSDPSSEYHAIIVNIGTTHVSAGFVGEAEPEKFLQWGQVTASAEDALPPHFGLDHALTAVERQRLIGSATSDPSLRALSGLFSRDRTCWFPFRSHSEGIHADSLRVEIRAKITSLLVDHLLVTPSRAKIFVVDSSMTDVFRNIFYDVLLLGIEVRSIYSIPEPVLTVVGANSQSGLVVDISWDKITVMPVIDLRMIGECSYENYRELTGMHLHYQTLQMLLELQNPDITQKLQSAGGFRFVKNLTRSMYCKETDEEGRYFEFEGFTIPNSTRHQPVHECFLADSVLARHISLVVERCPVDVRSQLMNSVCFTGLVSAIPGFKSCVMQQIRDVGGKHARAISSLGSFAGFSLYASTKLVKEEHSRWKASEVTKRTWKKH